MEDRINYKGYTIEICPDDDAGNPRTEWDEASHMVCWHNRYNLGDLEKGRPVSRNYRDPEQFLREMAGIDEDDEEEYSMGELYEKIEAKGTIMNTLYLYDHSGITISSKSFRGRAHHAEWDSGPVGYQYMTKEDIIREYGNDRPEDYEQARKIMDAEVRTYDDFLRGEVYGFRVLDKSGDVIESCWGFYGSDGIEDIISQAKSIVDYEINRVVKNHLKQLKAWIVGKVPIIYRKPLQLT